MKYADIKNLSPEEQEQQLREVTEELQQLRFAHAISPIENPMRIRQSKRHIAQIKTAQNAQVLNHN
ncbi:MAG: 50S ribosomal protein L29 [Bacteroidota bacterium]